MDKIRYFLSGCCFYLGRYVLMFDIGKYNVQLCLANLFAGVSWGYEFLDGLYWFGISLLTIQWDD